MDMVSPLGWSTVALADVQMDMDDQLGWDTDTPVDLLKHMGRMS